MALVALMATEYSCNNALRITNAFSQHRGVHKHTWCRVVTRCFCIVAVDLFRSVLDDQVKSRAELSTDYYRVEVCNLHLDRPPGATKGAGPGDPTEYSGRQWRTKMQERPSQTACRLCSENSRKAQRTRRLSGGCSQQLYLHLLRGYVDGNHSVWRIMV